MSKEEESFGGNSISHILSRFDKIDARIEKIEDTINSKFLELKSEFSSLRSYVDDTNQRIDQIEDSQSFISKQYESQRKICDKIMSSVSQFEKENADLIAINAKLKHYLKEERIERIELAQYQRRNMIEISGIPRENVEDTSSLVEKVAELAGLSDFNKKQIDVSHRTSTKDKAPIIVLFKERNFRESFYRQRKGVRNLHVKQLNDPNFKFDTKKKREADTKIFINESLTPEKKELFKLTKKAATEAKYDYVWTHHGSISVRKNELSPSFILIRCEDDLIKIR